MRILILRYSSIGDIVLTTPVIRCLRKTFPDAEIAFATKEKFAELIQPNPYCNHLFLLTSDFQAHLNALKNFQPDCIIDLHNNLRTARIKSALRVTSHVFDKVNFEKWLLVNFKWNLMPYKHIVARYLETTNTLGVQDDGEGLDYFFPTRTEQENADLQHMLPKVPFVAYAVGGQHGTKRLPPDRIKALLEMINKPVVLLGDNNDAMVLKESLAHLDHVVNLCGKLSLSGSAMVIQKSAQVISHDTGLMHIAAALRKPVISLWGNTVPDFGMTPFYPENTNHIQSQIVQVDDLACRPCSKLGFEVCPKGHFSCMREIDLQEVVNALR